MKLRNLMMCLLIIFIISAPIFSQVFIYEHFCKADVEFTRLFTPNFNGYFVNPKPDTLLINMQLGLPVVNVPKKHSLSLGIGVEGTNGFERFTFGVWGSFTLWSDKDFDLKQVICRSSFNTRGEHIIRLMTQLTYKKLICIAPNLFRNTFADIDIDIGGTISVNTPLFIIGATHWFIEQKEWWLMIIKSF